MRYTVLLTELPEDEKVVSMVTHKDRVIIATERAIYELTEDNTLTQVAMRELKKK